MKLPSLLLIIVVVIMLLVVTPYSMYAAAGINKTINFQSRVINVNGTNVTDGTYDFVFKIYDGAGSAASALFTESWTAAALWSSTLTSAPASNGESLVYSSNVNEATIKVGQILTNTTKSESVVVTSVNTGTNTVGISPTRQAWANSDTVTNKIYVKNGIFRVAINSLNQSISGVDFNSDTIFLGVNFNADGEAKPRIQMAASPYAFNAEKVAGLTLSGTSGNTYSFPTTNSGTVITSNAPTQVITSTQTSGAVLGLTDSTALTAAITGLSITLSGTGAFDQSGLAFNLSNASGTNLNDILGTGSLWRVSKAGALTVASATVASGALAINSGSVTSTTDLTLDASSKVIIPSADTFESNDVTAPAATGLTFTGNAASAFNTSTGAITMQAAGTGTTSSVQIGAGGVGSTTPDLLVLDIKSDAGDPTGSEGGLYYNTNTDKFRCYQAGAWVDCVTTAPGGSTTQIQYNDAGAMGGDADFVWDKTGNTLTLGGTDTGLIMQGITSEPGTPSAGTLEFYAKSLAGRMMPKWKGPSGLDNTIQSGLFFNQVMFMYPNTGATVNNIGFPNTPVGTVSTPTLVSTNLHTSMKMMRVTSSALANSASEMRSAQTLVWRGNAASLGGFFYTCRFSVNTAVANQRVFIGLHSAITAIATNQSPSSLTNILGVGWDSADTTLQFMANDGSGTATKTNLGVNFPANSTTAVYELIMFAAPNGSDVSYRVERLDSAQVATGTVSAAGDLPASTTFLTRHEYMNNGGTASAVVLDVAHVYIESDY